MYKRKNNNIKVAWFPRCWSHINVPGVVNHTPAPMETLLSWLTQTSQLTSGLDPRRELLLQVQPGPESENMSTLFIKIYCLCVNNYRA